MARPALLALLVMAFGLAGADAAGAAITEFGIPTAAARPAGIAAGPDGALWFTEGAQKIGRITTAGALTEFALPAAPADIAPGPDGALWFTEQSAHRIGRITTAGAVTEFALPADSAPGSI